ncbi:unnamed protein product [Lactuca saligna]|uniref:Uncharacterized protein n=1 Tax=Lactuca saligna TaxID=75948 RepID=A0AA35VHS6_LACSI|nr:unnamed protein product [Lactuca saligna]
MVSIPMSSSLSLLLHRGGGGRRGGKSGRDGGAFHLVVTLLSTLINNDEVASTAHSFLEANSGVDVCQKILQIWDRLKPSTQVVLAVASEMKKLQKHKDHLRINLTKAEEEVIVLCDENILDKENAIFLILVGSIATIQQGAKS